MDILIFWSINLWTFDLWISCSLTFLIFESLTLWIIGLLISVALALLIFGFLFFEFLALWILGFDWIFDSLGSWIFGSLDYWVRRSLVSRIFGSLDLLIVRTLDSWSLDVWVSDSIRSYLSFLKPVNLLIFGFLVLWIFGYLNL